MKTSLGPCRQWARRICGRGARGLHTGPLLPVQTAVPTAQGLVDIQAFRQQAFRAKKPVVFRSDAGSPAAELPALSCCSISGGTRWFAPGHTGWRRFSSWFVEMARGAWPVRYELSLTTPETKDAAFGFRDWLREVGFRDCRREDAMNAEDIGLFMQLIMESKDQTFWVFPGPFELLVWALEFNRARRSQGLGTVHLYIAQSEIGALPECLRQDVSAPELVTSAGKGDIYDSSLWFGPEPTYTPLHRDPNPNLFCQLCGSKAVRLLPPPAGDALFQKVQSEIGHKGNSRIRDADMMNGMERKPLHEAVWNDAKAGNLYEVELHTGDALFIPEGWWHSIKSKGAEGELNGSVNWWFR